MAVTPGHGAIRSLRCSPAIGKDGTIYVNTYHAARLPPRWQLRVEVRHAGDRQDVPSSPAIGKDSTIYFGGGGEYEGKGGYFYALHPDGSLKWSYFAGCGQTAPTIGGDGTIYFGSDWCGAIPCAQAEQHQQMNLLQHLRLCPHPRRSSLTTASLRPASSADRKATDKVLRCYPPLTSQYRNP